MCYAYIRSDDIVSAVGENIAYIKPPLREVFQAFVGDATAVSSNTKRALMNLKDKIDDEIFDEWCDTLIQCQDDRTLKDTLQPVVAKLTDVRVVNNELRTMLSSVRNEYWMMVALVAGNIPLLYFLNREWFNTLMFTTPGKVVLGICGMVILITALFMVKFTKPIHSTLVVTHHTPPCEPCNFLEQQWFYPVIWIQCNSCISSKVSGYNRLVISPFYVCDFVDFVYVLVSLIK